MEGYLAKITAETPRLGRDVRAPTIRYRRRRAVRSRIVKCADRHVSDELDAADDPTEWLNVAADLRAQTSTGWRRPAMSTVAYHGAPATLLIL